MATTPSIYEEMVRITHSYLGPAADRFISRQVYNHLHKSPEELTRKDLLKLVDWIQVCVSLLTDDSEIIEEYSAELRKLATTSKQPKRKAKDGKE